VQEANRRYEQGIRPKMLMKQQFDNIHFGEVIDEIFSLDDRDKSKELIEFHSKLWTQMQSGSQGLSGKRTINALTSFNMLFEEQDDQEDFVDDEFEDSDEMMKEMLGE
jgi:hypothetical protein